MSLAEELRAEAEALERSGDQARAHERWLAAASEDGRSTRILNGLGRSHMLLGHLTEAEAILRQVSLLDAEDGESLWLLGFVLHSQGRWDDARNALERGLARSEWSTARIMLGEVCWRLGDSNSALQHYARALVANLRYGQFLERQGRLARTWSGLWFSILTMPERRVRSSG
jgi:tetratricopeptide (TPR) repeat protein